MTDRKKHAKELLEYLKKCDKAYYLLGEPLVDDDKYDQLRKDLEAFSDLPEVARYLDLVGYESKKDQVDLPVVMGSLANYWPENIEAFLDSLETDEIFMSLKLDGISVLVEFDNGEIQFAALRNSEKTGTDITDLAPFFVPKPKSKSYFLLRGEILLTGSAHKKLGKKNRRNAAFGILNRKSYHLLHLLQVRFYEVIDPSFKTCQEQFEFLEKHHFKVAPWRVVKKNSALRELNDFYLSREKLDYDCDGVVLCPNKYEREDIKRPKRKVAYKVNLTKKKTLVRDIEFKTTRTREISAVILVEPVDFGAIRVSRVTAHNVRRLIDLGIGPGAEIEVVRSADVIPEVVSVLKPAKVIYPKACPACGAPTVLKEEAAALKCSNQKCLGADFARLYHYVRTLEIDGLGLKTFEKVYKIADNITSLYLLKKEDLTSLEGIQEKTAEKILKSLEEKKTPPAEVFLTALGIPHLGLTTSKKLLEKIPDLDQIFAVSPKDLLDIEGIGSISAEIISEELNLLRATWEKLKALGIQPKLPKKTSFSYSLTGKLDRPRKEITQILKEYGGELTNLSKKTSFLIVGKKPGSKVARAQKLGVFIKEVETVKELEDFLKNHAF